MSKLTSIILAGALVAINGCAALQPKSSNSVADTQEIFNEFTKLDSSIEVGVNYSNYINKLTDVNTALKKYKQLGKANQADLDVLQKAFDGYLIAGEFWGMRADLRSA